MEPGAVFCFVLEEWSGSQAYPVCLPLLLRFASDTVLQPRTPNYFCCRLSVLETLVGIRACPVCRQGLHWGLRPYVPARVSICSAHSQPSAGGAGQRGALLDLGHAPDSVQFLSVPSQSSGGPSSVVGPIHHPPGRALSGASALSATSLRVRFGGRFVLPLPCPGGWFLPSTLSQEDWSDSLRGCRLV